MNHVVIPTYRRPAMLHAMLTTLEHTRNACYQRYLVSFDRGAYKQNHLALRALSCPFAIVKRSHNYIGSTYNILESVKSAVEQTKPTDLVYVIAEDVLLTQDFFSFHEQAHRLDPQAAFVSGTLGIQDPGRPGTWRDALTEHLASGDSSLVYRNRFVGELRAISFKAFKLASALEHAVPKYYRSMIDYCAQHLDVGFPITDVEAPGLIRRVFDKSSDYGLYPVRPRACHVGYVGTNRGGRQMVERRLNPTDWAEDSAAIRSMSSDQLNAGALPEYRDIERCELITEATALRLV